MCDMLTSHDKHLWFKDPDFPASRADYYRNRSDYYAQWAIRALTKAHYNTAGIVNADIISPLKNDADSLTQAAEELRASAGWVIPEYHSDSGRNGGVRLPETALKGSGEWMFWGGDARGNAMPGGCCRADAYVMVTFESNPLITTWGMDVRYIYLDFAGIEIDFRYSDVRFIGPPHNRTFFVRAPTASPTHITVGRRDRDSTVWYLLSVTINLLKTPIYKAIGHDCTYAEELSCVSSVTTSVCKKSDEDPSQINSRIPGWGQPFTMSFARDPKWTTLAVVSGDTVANDAFWLARCLSLPSDANMIRLEMGTVVDFYRSGPT